MIKRMIQYNYVLKTIAILLFMAGCASINAQKLEKVQGKYTYDIGENEEIILSKVKQECILRAQEEAIREKFPEIISSNTTMVDANVNGKAIEIYEEKTSSDLRAEWIRDICPPKISFIYADDHLALTAEVWGEAREIFRSKIDLEWKIFCGGTTDELKKNDNFKNKERFYVKFRSPADGYIAIYLVNSEKKVAQCLLPYRNNAQGSHEIKAGKQYTFFDERNDPNAVPYQLETTDQYERDNVVLLYSPNKFIKCNDNFEYQLPNILSKDVFENWLSQLRIDKDLVVDRSRWITIINK